MTPAVRGQIGSRMTRRADPGYLFVGCRGVGPASRRLRVDISTTPTPEGDDMRVRLLAAAMILAGAMTTAACGSSSKPTTTTVGGGAPVTTAATGSATSAAGPTTTG